MLDTPSLYLHEVQKELHDITGSFYDCATICRAIKRLGLSRKKMRRVALQRCELKQAEFISEVLEFDPSMLVFVDETGSDRRNSVRKYGYSKYVGNVHVCMLLVYVVCVCPSEQKKIY